MNKIIFGIAVLFVGLAACTSKQDSDYTPVTATNLNSMETQLQGIWHVQMETDSQQYYINNVLSTDTTQTFAVSYTGYDSAYTDLTDTAYTSYSESGYLFCSDASGLGAGLTFTPANTPTGGYTYWYYDNTLNKLVVSGYQYDIVNFNDSTLVLHRSATDSNITNIRYYYFKK